MYDLLSVREKAGLFIHEAIYWDLRNKFRVKTSTVARNITACAMAEQPCPQLNRLNGIHPEGEKLKCVSDTTGQKSEVIAYQLSENISRFQIIRLRPAGLSPASSGLRIVPSLPM